MRTLMPASSVPPSKDHPLRRYRDRHDLRLIDLAEALGITASTLSRIEGGTAKPSFDLMRRILQVTRGRVTGDELLEWAPDSPECAA